MQVSRRRSAGVGMLLVGIGAVCPSPAAAGSFEAVGSMAAPRYEPVVLSQPDGSALVIGGWRQEEEKKLGVALVERFDPRTNQFTALGSLSEPRGGHAALRLPDGRLLVIGGVSDFSSVDAANQSFLFHADLFDPATGATTRAGKMAGKRGNPTLNLLPDGRVLVAGGWTDNPSTPSTEIFDPATGQFSRANPMFVRRYRHASVTLPDGRVAVVGGYTLANRAVAAVEIYDPGTGGWQSAGTLMEGRGDTPALLLPDGRIFVAGGANSENEAVSSVEIFDLSTASPRVVARLPRPVEFHNPVLLRDGRVLIAGGVALYDASTREDQVPSLIFNPATAELAPAGPMVMHRDSAGAALLGDGRVLLVGGYGFAPDSDDYSQIATAEVYVP